MNTCCGWTTTVTKWTDEIMKKQIRKKKSREKQIYWLSATEETTGQSHSALGSRRTGGKRASGSAGLWSSAVASGRSAGQRQTEGRFGVFLQGSKRERFVFWKRQLLLPSEDLDDGGSGSDAVADTAKSILEEIGLVFGKKSAWEEIRARRSRHGQAGGDDWRREMEERMAGKKGDGRWEMAADRWWLGALEATRVEKWRGRKEVGDGGYKMVVGSCRSRLEEEEAVRWRRGKKEMGMGRAEMRWQAGGGTREAGRVRRNAG
ncbi:hypothetical protein ACLOJK_023481 [Asimina triloba]